MKRQKRKIVLFLDNCTANNSPPTLSNVELYFFPPNTTSKLQPVGQGIIHNLKTLDLTEVVKIVLESLNKQLITNITDLTAILLIGKAWRAVTPLKGFVKDDQDNSQIIMDDEEPSMVPVVDISDVSFSVYVQVYEDVAVSGSLTDGEILSATDTNEKSNDEDEDVTSEPLTEVSVQVARASFDNLQSFCLQNKTDETAYQALFLLQEN
ncbi:tigger transposable element-derived protein 6-like [Anastrepha obliqua]|uniref:tigger transposable element-derived protein 6-like n=1 Tax=Anastrepha obliqua TaxID=95512 RepID=UPI0024090562|nr:tigger transposable element-derived protein 6-like [Anastrepha obliqua]